MIREVDDKNILEIIQSIENKIVIVDYYSNLCNPCKMMEPTLLQLDKLRGNDLVILKLDVDKYHEFASKINIESVPTTIFYRNGEEIDRIFGFQILKTIEDRINKLN